MMDKSELLFQMMEQPEQYSAEQWREVLADEECKELYTMLSKVQSAVDDERVSETLSDEQIGREWDSFSAKHNFGNNPSRWQRVAAVAAIAMVCIGLAIAAVYSHVFGIDNTDERSDTTVENATAATEADDLPDREFRADEPQSHLYDNVPLEQIINDMSAYYNVQVEWRSDEARDLRLYYQWEPSFTLDKVVDMLNSFEAINITREGDKIIIKQAE